jgi:hypothetical protein
MSLSLKRVAYYRPAAEKKILCQGFLPPASGYQMVTAEWAEFPHVRGEPVSPSNFPDGACFPGFSSPATKQALRRIPPPNRVCKLNVDGAVARWLRQGVVGAVCRSHNGVFLGASAVVFEGVTHRDALKLWHTVRAWH